VGEFSIIPMFPDLYYKSPWELPYTPPPGFSPTIPYSPLPFYPAIQLSHRPHKCPVCEGKGVVPAGFYTDDVANQKCRPCGGKGVIWG
jgi:hypothetical protein